MDAFVKRCIHCQKPISENVRGRPQRFCSDRCRQAHRKIAATPENGLRYRTGRVKPKSASEAIELAPEFKPENLSPKASTPLKCEKVNEVTFKVTNGELTNVPASHGQWGGYRTTKALAWVICVVPGKWLARCRDMVCGPLSLTKAKPAAMKMAKGAVGDYYIGNPIAHLNGLTARLINSETVPLPDVRGGHE